MVKASRHLDGRVAQWLERVTYIHKVSGSSPDASTLKMALQKTDTRDEISIRRQ